MKKTKFLSLFIVMIMLVVAVVPASAQDLGDDDSSAFMVQNTAGVQVTVTIQFVNSTGAITQPTCLDGSNPCTFPNPFTLAIAASREIAVGSVPLAQLPAGKYSVIISSTGQVVAVATVSSAGTNQFTGGYTSFATGASTMYLSTVNFNWTATPWYSMVTVMNLGDVAIPTVTFTIKCANSGFVGVTGTLTKTNLAAKASHTFVLKNTTPTGFTGATSCQGGGTLVSSNGQPLAVVNNNNQPSFGKTNTFEGVITGSSKVFLPQINSMFTQWISAINILKQGAGNTTVTVDWGDGTEPSDTCSLTDAAPSCQMIAHSVRSQGVRTSAVVTSSNGMTLLVSVGSSRTLPGPGYSGGYNGLSSGTNAVALPLIMRNYLGWFQAINCMNVSSTPDVDLKVEYEGKAPYTIDSNLDEGASLQIVTTSDPALNDGYLGSAVISAVGGVGQIACMVGSSNPTQAGALAGDWTEQYISLPK